MGLPFFQLPFRPQVILDRQEHPKAPNLETAIGEHLAVILRTVRGESPGNPDYGCRIWDHLAERVRGEFWLSQFSDDIKEAVELNEQRLTDVKVEITSARPGSNDLSLTITALTVPSGKPFRFSRIILTDPIRMS